MANKHTMTDLLQMQSLPLEAKIGMTRNRIKGWINEFGTDGVYISFSGGKDSTVLLDIVRNECGYTDIPAVFVDVPTQYPELKEFATSFENVTVLKPKISFMQVCEKYGFPLTFHPSNLMGDNLSDRYRKDIVPDLLQDLKDCAPEIYQRFTAEFPEYIYEPNYIGKEVYVNSLKPGTRFTRNGQAWIYDGEYVTSENEIGIGVYSPWCFQESSKSMISLKVNDKMTVKVESNDIIDENTRFV